MDFMFEWQERYLTSERSKRVHVAIGACSSRRTSCEINLKSQCDKFNITTSPRKPGAGHATPRGVF